jgi:hypothetical protein
MTQTQSVCVPSHRSVSVRMCATHCAENFRSFKFWVTVDCGRCHINFGWQSDTCPPSFAPSSVLEHATWTWKLLWAAGLLPVCSPLPATTKNAHACSYSATKVIMFTNFLLCLVILFGISSKWNLKFFILPGCVFRASPTEYVTFDTAKGHVQKDSLLNNSGVLGALHSTSDVINFRMTLVRCFCSLVIKSNMTDGPECWDRAEVILWSSRGFVAAYYCKTTFFFTFISLLLLFPTFSHSLRLFSFSSPNPFYFLSIPPPLSCFSCTTAIAAVTWQQMSSVLHLLDIRVTSNSHK